jgi:hypothetical protein
MGQNKDLEVFKVELMDEDFIQKAIIQKAKQYDYLPLAYNSELVNH